MIWRREGKARFVVIKEVVELLIKGRLRGLRVLRKGVFALKAAEEATAARERELVHEGKQIQCETGLDEL